jgi:hypothetical protein
MRADEFLTEAPRDVFHFVGHSPSVPRPTGNYYKWQVDLSNGQHYYIRAGAYTKLEKFQQYFTRKWGAEMPDVEVVDATRLERLSEGDLEEMAGSIHGGVRQVLDKKGYRYLGGGIDKQAFLEPGTGQVLVIFGYNKAAQGGFSSDQMMFVDWAKYCKKNKANPHLPRFSDWASFDFQGKRYLQIRMEPLQELSDYLKMIIVNLEEVAKYSKSNPKTAYKKLANFANFNLLDAGEPDDLDHKAIVKNLGGEQAAYNLLKTVYDVKKFGKQHGFKIDLHSGNYMQRADGTIVVNDPYVLTFY